MRRARVLVVFLGLLLIASMAFGQGAFAADDSSTQVQLPPQYSGPGHKVKRESPDEADVNVCSTDVGEAIAHCDARVRIDNKAKSARPDKGVGARPNALGNGGAYDPSYLQSAYNLAAAIAGGAGAGQTVAIVDAYDNPNAESDLAFYRSYFGLLPCTTANGCFRKVDQNGGQSYPTPDQGWAEEISLDLDMVSAICPSCNILLVEAKSAGFNDLTTAVNTAVNLGAVAVSNSYGASEFSFESWYDSAYNHPGVAITVSSGDAGYGAEYPAASPNAIAVGGTSLHQNSNTGTRDGTETVWNGAGSGCSRYEAKQSWQTDSGCTKRTLTDVSAVADPYTGVWVYDTYKDSGFMIFGGTSASAPIIASVYALAGNGGSSDSLTSYPYNHPEALNDVVSGSNGRCTPSYLCTAGTGYDGPTGLGTPNGLTAFQGSGNVVVKPSISSVSPQSGSTAGGTSVTITGSGFSGATSVKFGTTTATGFTVNSATMITATAPAHSSGSVDITVTTPNGTSTTGSADQFTYVTPSAGPAVSGLSVSSGPVTGGTAVTISGSGFTGATAVKFGGTAVSFQLNNDASISATTPGHAAGTVDVTVTTGSGTSATSPADQFSFTPVVTSISPSSGPSGTQVTVNGNGFTGATSVKFGSSAGTSLSVINDSQLQITAPAGSGTVDITVTSAGVTSPTSAADQFSYTVATPSFTLSATPSSQSVRRYGTARFTVNVAAVNGFSSRVTFSVTGQPRGTTVSFSPSSVTGGGTSTLSVRSSSIGTYTLTITATGGGVTQTTTVTLMVTK